MQTTLLGLGIAIILALVAALVGPHFVDWSSYRTTFEEHASKAIGTPVHIAGPIDARLLPTPSLTLHDLQGEGTAGPVRVRAASIEFSLGALMRGEWRATNAHVSGLDANVSLDAQGRVAGLPSASPREVESLAIERLRIDESRIVFTDARSGSRLSLDQFWFSGDVRSLAGPIKGEGGGLGNGERFGYRVSMARPGDDGARLRLAVEPVGRPIAGEIDALVRNDNGVLRLDGALTLMRLAAANVDIAPWKVSGRVKADSVGALFEQVELEYGQSERSIKLGGTAELKFGAKPSFDAILSARQIDMDRLLAQGDAPPQAPLAILKQLATDFAGSLQPKMPVRLGVAIDQINLAAGAIQSLRGDLASTADGWELSGLEFRAPGFAQVRASGRLAFANDDVTFSGPVSLQATEPRSFAAWLEGRRPGTSPRSGPLSISGDVSVSNFKFAIKRLRAEIDRKPMSGSIVWSGDDRSPSRLDVQLIAAELDVESIQALLKATGTDARLPDQIGLRLDIGRVKVAGHEAAGVKAKLRFGRDGLSIDELALRDLAGASVDAGGTVQGPWTRPQGNLVLNIAGNKLEGLAVLLAQIAPPLSPSLTALAPGLGPAKLRVVLTIASPKETSLTAKVDGTAGGLRVAATMLASGDAQKWEAAAVQAQGRFDADDSRALTRFIGVDTQFAAATGAGQLNWKATRAANAELRLEGSVVLPGLEATAAGQLRQLEDGFAGEGDLSLKSANAMPLRPLLARTTAAVPLVLKAKFKAEPQRIVLEGLAGSLAGIPFNGRLNYMRDLGALDGRLETDVLDGTAVLAALLGVPQGTSGADVWSAQTIGTSILAGLQGKIELSAKRALISPFEIRQFQAQVRFFDGGVTLEDIGGTIAGGKLSANFSSAPGSLGTNAEMRIALTDVDLAALLVGIPKPPIGGRTSAMLEAKGSGRSVASIVASLNGAGTISIDRGSLFGFDPDVFVAVDAIPDTSAADVAKTKAAVEAGLARGSFRISRADSTLMLRGGQLRLSNLLAKGERSSLLVSGGIDLTRYVLDARLTLSDDRPTETVAGKPEINIAVRGPLWAPRREVDVSALVGWLALRAVDRQAKRLEVLEAERNAAEAALEKMQPPTSVSAPNPSEPPNPVPSLVPSVPPPPPAMKPDVRRPAVLAPEPLVPPTDIRPPPGRRPAAQIPERLPPANSVPPRPRTIFDLFGASR